MGWYASEAFVSRPGPSHTVGGPFKGATETTPQIHLGGGPARASQAVTHAHERHHLRRQFLIRSNLPSTLRVRFHNPVKHSGPPFVLSQAVFHLDTRTWNTVDIVILSVR